MGGTSSRSLVRVGVSCPSVSCASLEEEAAGSGLADRNVGMPTEGGVHRLVLVRVGERGGRDGECADKLGDDMTAREEEGVRYGEPRDGGGAFVVLGSTTDVFMDLKLPRSRDSRDWVGTGVSAHLTRAMTVRATRARESEVASMRSSRWKRSSDERPLAEQEARNLVTFDIRSLPSSRGSIRAIDPGRNLFISLDGMIDREEAVNIPPRNQGEKNLLA